MVSDAGGQAAATAAMDKSAFAHLEGILRDETKGEYVVGRMLGRGGMAVVYLAEETRLGRKVALKVLPPELTFGHGVDRFLREAKTAATLDHPHIIPIYRIAAGGKLFWYAMKYLEGNSLEDVLRERGTYSVEETIEILEQVADALDYAHEHQVIHRDIKPANVMLDSRSRVIITDFGIAKALSEGALTASGSVIGTPYFMSPEQGMGKPVAGAADQYSVAVMTFRMLAGHIPFDGDSAIDILHKHCMMPAPRLDDEHPEIPKHICDAVEKAMSKKAADRFPNIRTFVKALKDPNFRYARASSASTVVIDTGELAKVNSGPLPKVTAKSAANAARAAANAADKTVVAGPPAKPGAVKPAPAPEPKSKMGLYAAIGVLVLGGVGYGVFAMGQQDGKDTQLADSQQTALSNPATNAPATLPSNTALPSPTVTPPVVEPTPAPVTNSPTKSATKSVPPQPRPQPTPTTTKVVQTPPVTAPATTPQQSAPTPTAPTPTAPAPSTPPAAAATTGLLQLRISAPAVLSIDGVDKGERRNFSEDLNPGRHLVKAVTRDGTQSAEQVINVVAGETLRVTLTLQAKP